MPITSRDIVPLNKVRASLTSLAEEARAGHEKVITRNGESYVALIDARRLDHYHRIEREHFEMTLLQDVLAGLEDVDAGRTMSVEEFKQKYGRK